MVTTASQGLDPESAAQTAREENCRYARFDLSRASPFRTTSTRLPLNHSSIGAGAERGRTARRVSLEEVLRGSPVSRQGSVHCSHANSRDDRHTARRSSAWSHSWVRRPVLCRNRSGTRCRREHGEFSADAARLKLGRPLGGGWKSDPRLPGDAPRERIGGPS